ncbi:hypothetical protein PINS_up015717 [Pythium insidiosum]|nr:hypothetical protein PINS_up015717 [Pythium insidiosum]
MLSRVSRNALRLARRSSNQRFAQVAFFSTESEETPAIKNELELSPKVKSVARPDRRAQHDRDLRAVVGHPAKVQHP